MLVSSLELIFARDKLEPLPKTHEIDFSKQSAAQVRLNVKMPEIERNRGCSVTAALSVKCLGLKKKDETALLMGVARHDPKSTEFQEVDRLVLQTSQDITFQYDFSIDNEYELRLKLTVTDDITGTIQWTGWCFISLDKILMAPRELLPVPILDRDEKKTEATLAVSVLWMRDWEDRLVFEMRIKIDKKVGWPFSTSRLFFLIYRYSERDKDWQPIYRSEVLTKASDHPHAEGSMYFQLAQLKCIYLERTDAQPLRIEFFHFKTTDCAKMLAQLTTSRVDLRQTDAGEPLPLNVNTFPEGELVGRLNLVRKVITKTTSYYSLLVNFGGDIQSNAVVLDIKLQVAKLRYRPRRSLVSKRLFFVVSKRGNAGAWESVHRSEVSSKIYRAKLINYKRTKITTKRLYGSDPTRPISIEFFYESVPKGQVSVGKIETSVQQLSTLAPNGVLDITTQDSSRVGYGMLDQRENTGSGLYVSVIFVFGRPGPEESNHEGAMSSPTKANNAASVADGEKSESVAIAT